MKRWVSIQFFKRLWYQFWRESDRISNRAWQQWGFTLLIGWTVCALVMLVLTLVTQHYVEQGSLQAWDEAQLPRLAEALPLSFSRAITWESPGNLLGMLPVVGVFTAITILRSQPLLTATMLMAYGLQFSLVWIGWGYWNRSRPELIADGVAASGLHSFPSGHTVVVITVYGLLAFLWWRFSRHWAERLLVTLLGLGWLSLIISSRLVLGAHWPSDVIVGIVVGVLWLVAVLFALVRGETAARKIAGRWL